MVEIFNVGCTVSLGCFETFKAAKCTLTELASGGELGTRPAVMVCCYKNNEPQREYTATYSGGKWHVPRLPKSSVPLVESRVKRRRKKRLCKEYKCAEEMFSEGFPDWMNRSYPVPACIQQGLNVRQRINH